jgi:UPF0271 protein
VRINCDIGERGAHHPVDRELMRHIDIANIACGGHAGDTESIAAFRGLAEEHGVDICAHLSYPDREHFGRRSLDIEPKLLSEALDEQLQRIPGVAMVKFHGALYNDSVRNPILAGHLAAWLLRNSITVLIAPAGCEMARAAAKAGIPLLAEAFADRRYCRGKNGQLQLVSRSHPQAVFQTLEDALRQSHGFVQNRVRLQDGNEAEIQADTLCIHSDSEIAVPLLHALRNELPPFHLIRRGLSSFVRAPAFGHQSLGVTPGGPQDRFAFETAHALLASETKHSLEFIIPPVLHMTRTARLILTGAHFDSCRIERGRETLPLPHATVFRAEPGDILRFGKIRTGLRACLSWDTRRAERCCAERCSAPFPPSQNAFLGRQRPPLDKLITWHEPHGHIRLLPGPETSWMVDPDALVSKHWKIGSKSGPMGIQLDNPGKPLDAQHQNMISAPVTDGTVQLTPAGPIILMRHRQTVGGYPRIANVIEVDLDRLAQFRPGETVRFTWTDLDTARDLLEQRNAAIGSLASIA